MTEGQAQWQFNANPDPFSSTEPQWTAYSKEDNELIEQKFQSQARKTELKSYVI
ncbi:hypothetical protein D7Y04_42800, partial [Corallococcus sp. AB038B]